MPNLALRLQKIVQALGVKKGVTLPYNVPVPESATNDLGWPVKHNAAIELARSNAIWSAAEGQRKDAIEVCAELGMFGKPKDIPRAGAITYDDPYVSIFVKINAGTNKIDEARLRSVLLEYHSPEETVEILGKVIERVPGARIINATLK